MSRAVTARLVLGANPPKDAIYMSTFTDGDGHPLDGSAWYRMHFDNGDIPPVDAFWSITAYNKDGYFIANPLDRYAVGDRDPLKVNADGSLELYVQNENPGPDHESNWLPSGDRPFNLKFRLYWPKEAFSMEVGNRLVWTEYLKTWTLLAAPAHQDCDLEIQTPERSGNAEHVDNVAQAAVKNCIDCAIASTPYSPASRRGTSIVGTGASPGFGRPYGVSDE